jgi:hypothetical protein
LQGDPADLRRIGTRLAAMNRREGEKPTRLGGVFSFFCRRSQLTWIKMSPQRSGMANLPGLIRWIRSTTSGKPSGIAHIEILCNFRKKFIVDKTSCTLRANKSRQRPECVFILSLCCDVSFLASCNFVYLANLTRVVM